jgi:ribosome biogenesis GTPase
MTEIARVAASTGSWYKLFDEQGQEVLGRLKGKMRLGTARVTNPVAVGDRVTIARNADGTASIISVLERDNAVVRESTHRKKEAQILAANLDLAIVVQSFRAPKYKTGFIDRFLVTCEAYHVPAMIVINKSDLVDVSESKERTILQETYQKVGYPLLFTSINDPESIERLRTHITGKTSLFLGQSGVGKSSLLNALSDGLARKTAAVSTFNEKGKHTTTFAEMLLLDPQTYVIDTPGLRELGLSGLEPYEISYCYPEMAPLKRTCQYQHCLCIQEPDCPVQKAFEDGLIPPSRMESYLQIVDSLAEQK